MSEIKIDYDNQSEMISRMNQVQKGRSYFKNNIDNYLRRLPNLPTYEIKEFNETSQLKDRYWPDIATPICAKASQYIFANLSRDMKINNLSDHEKIMEYSSNIYKSIQQINELPTHNGERKNY